MAAAGIDPSIIVVKGYGKSSPLSLPRMRLPEPKTLVSRLLSATRKSGIPAKLL